LHIKILSEQQIYDNVSKVTIVLLQEKDHHKVNAYANKKYSDYAAEP